MPGPEHILASIDAARETQVAAEARAADLINDVAKFVTAVAANEVSYELAASANLSEPVSLKDISSATDTARSSLTDSIEAAILASKDAFRAQHEQDLLRAMLVQDLETPES